MEKVKFTKNNVEYEVRYVEENGYLAAQAYLNDVVVGNRLKMSLEIKHSMETSGLNPIEIIIEAAKNVE